MSSKDIRSDFIPIQEHIDRFGLGHTADVAQEIADVARVVTVALGRAWKRFGAAMERGYIAELDRRAVESDAFLRRSAPRY
jgi:hypothetical protein